MFFVSIAHFKVLVYYRNKEDMGIYSYILSYVRLYPISKYNLFSIFPQPYNKNVYASFASNNNTIFCSRKTNSK